MDITKTEFLKGISHELKFWQTFVKTPRFLNGWVNNIKTPELDQFVHEFIRSNISKLPTAKVLDVGSGVVSILNGTVDKKILTTADPLGELYEVVFDYKKYNIAHPIAVPGEELNFENEFDIVHMSNAIDHAQAPALVIENLYRACKVGGYVILQGFENEGTFENWQGFHQWDISYELGYLKIKDKNGDLIVVNQFVNNTIESKKVEFESKTWYIWVFQKL